MQRLILFLSLLAPTASLAQLTDFKVAVVGPQNVVRGNSLYLSVNGYDLAGTDSQPVFPSISGLPTGVTARWLTMETVCCGNYISGLSGTNSLRLTASSGARTGRFPLVIQLRTAGGLERTATMTLAVWSSFPQPVRATGYPADTPLAQLGQWETSMTFWGNVHCNDTTFPNEGRVWYYDGMRNFYQIADRTGSGVWNGCAANMKLGYRPYVIANQGNVANWRVFPEGLVLDYERTGDLASRDAVQLLFANGGFVHPKPNTWAVAGAVSWEYSREVSYAINVHLANERLGFPRDADLPVLVDQLLGHFDQWFISRRTTYVQPFMVALAAESLIAYYQVTPDPRIPYVLKLAADSLRTRSWDAFSQSFRYELGDGTSEAAPDTNLLIAPLYGWVYRYTGDAKYRTWGDETFNSGVLNAWFGSGKTFSMSYRWSGKYTEWRTKPAGF